VYIAAVSRLMERPLNVFVKGSSGSGKNFIVKTILRFIPESEVLEITSSSGAAWSYQGAKLKNKVIYLQEENAASGNVSPTRLLISENKVIRQIAVKRGGRWITEQQVTEGPVACISTTTKNRLEVDDESRHVSLWVNETKEQTKQILDSMIEDANEGLPHAEIDILRSMQNFFRDRAKCPCEVPKWMKAVAAETNIENLRARRYFQAFLDACKVVSLIRSFCNRGEDFPGYLQLKFSDYAVTSIILSDAFSHSLSQANDEDIETRQWVEKLCAENQRPAQASDLARAQSLSAHEAYQRLRDASEAGLVARANPSEKGNKKLYLPAPRPSFLPDPANIFRLIAKPDRKLSFLHPVSGTEIIYER